MLQLSLNGVETISGEEQSRLQQEFTEHQCLFFKSFLAPSVLNRVSALFKEEEFYTRVDHDSEGHIFAREQTLAANHPLANLMWVLLNQPSLFELIEKIASLEPTVRFFRSRVYEFAPNPDHYDSWHDDDEKDQLIGLSINLSEKPVEGGEFEIRRVDDEKVLRRITGSEFGDAHLFRIGKSHEHRVLPVTGTVPRRSCAGWFCSKPDFREELKKMLRQPLEPDSPS